jgi:vacuolar-type H+-ATPase subunit I/STV1
MYERFAAVFVFALLAYAALGFLFAVAFVSFGVTRMDPEARGTKLGFRLLIMPGVMAFWPLLLQRWIGGATEPPAERDPHR